MAARVLLLAVLALAALLAAALYLAEWKEREEDLGYSLEALRNPYLAAEMFLSRLGVSVTTSNGLELLDALPDSNDTIMMSSARRRLSERRVGALLDWVREGGSLVLNAGEPPDEDDPADPLLERLGVTVWLADVPLEPGDRCGSAGGRVLVELEGESQPLTASLDDRRFLEFDGRSSAYWADNRIGTQLLALDFGQGSILVITTSDIWSNSAIRCADHAHLLRWLAEGRGTLWWLANAEMDSLIVEIWRRWPLAMVGCGVLFLLWCWQAGAPVLPRRAPDVAVRRQLMEHIEGMARFRWQQGEGDGLLEPSRNRVKRRWGIRQPDDAALDELAREASVTPESARRALFDSVGSSERAFQEVMAALAALDGTRRP